MKYVYCIIERGNYTDDGVVEICLTEEVAKRSLQKWIEDCDGKYYIQKWEVITE